MGKRKIKSLLLILLCIIQFALHAQHKGVAEDMPLTYHDKKNATADFSTYQIGEVNENNVKEFLTEKYKSSIKKLELKLLERSESNSGYHFLFAQYYLGYEVYGCEIKANCNKTNSIWSLFHTLENLPLISSTPTFIDSSAIQHYLQRNKFALEKSSSVIFYDGKKLVYATKLNVRNSSTRLEILLDAQGLVLFRKDLSSSFTNIQMKDTIVSASVFNPDPLSSAGFVYGGLYKDNADADAAELNNQRQTKNLHVDFVNDTFYLRNTHVRIEELSTPTSVPAFCKTNANFHYLREDNKFEDVNAYYHIYEFQSFIRGLGYSNIVNYSIKVDTHGLNGVDNSSFTPGLTESESVLQFGEGGVDDAEDADVVIHEYGHAVSYSCAPKTNNGAERKSLDEALCDYFASSYSKSLQSYAWERVYTWDGHNEFWSGRFSNTNKKYTNHLSWSNIYDNTDIWASVLMELYDRLGRNKTDKLLLESMFSYASNITMAQAATLYLKADSLLYNKANYDSICARFLVRGLVSGCGTKFIPNVPYLFDLSMQKQDVTCLGARDGIATVSISGGTAPFTYTWKTADGVELRKITRSEKTDTLTAVDGLSAIYKLEVRDSLLALDYDSIAVSIVDTLLCKLHFYNVITPNGDGENDTWWIDNIELYEERTIQIFDRWGYLVWQAQAYNNRDVVWKGRNKQDEDLPEGVYFYMAKVDDKNYSGWVQLLR